MVNGVARMVKVCRHRSGFDELMVILDGTTMFAKDPAPFCIGLSLWSCRYWKICLPTILRLSTFFHADWLRWLYLKR